MTSYQFEPMTVGGILDRTFRLYRENFVRFIAIVAVVYVPLGLLSFVVTTLVSSQFSGFEVQQAPAGVPVSAESEDQTPSAEPDPGAADGSVRGTAYDSRPATPSAGALMGMVISSLLLVFFAVVGTNLCNGALMKSVSETYLGRQSTVGEAYRFVLPKIGTLIWVSVMIGVIVGIGFLFCIVPGVIFSLWFALTTPAIVAESLKASGGMSRSKALASGNLGKVFGVMFVAVVIAWIIMSLFQWGGGYAVGALHLNEVLASGLSEFLAVIGQIVAVPIGATATILLYYDLRIRKEGFDLEMMAQSLNVPEARRVDWPQQ